MLKISYNFIRNFNFNSNHCKYCDLVIYFYCNIFYSFVNSLIAILILHNS